jgi:hypothetical protein
MFLYDEQVIYKLQFPYYVCRKNGKMSLEERMSTLHQQAIELNPQNYVTTMYTNFCTTQYKCWRIVERWEMDLCHYWKLEKNSGLIHALMQSLLKYMHVTRQENKRMKIDFCDTNLKNMDPDDQDGGWFCDWSYRIFANFIDMIISHHQNMRTKHAF